MLMFDKVFWKRALDRAIKTVAQTMLATIGATQVLTIFELPWNYIVGTSLFAGLLSILTAIVFPGVELKEAIKESVLAEIESVTAPPKTIDKDGDS